MPSRHQRVLISQAQGDPFIHKKIAGAFKIGKKIFKGVQAAFAGTKTAAVLKTAGAVATGAAIQSVATSITPGAGFVDPALITGKALVARAPTGLLVFDPVTGQHVAMPKRRRRRGITATELSGFRKVNRLLHSVGMTPRKTRRK